MTQAYQMILNALIVLCIVSGCESRSSTNTRASNARTDQQTVDALLGE